MMRKKGRTAVKKCSFYFLFYSSHIVSPLYSELQKNDLFLCDDIASTYTTPRLSSSKYSGGKICGSVSHRGVAR